MDTWELVVYPWKTILLALLAAWVIWKLYDGPALEKYYRTKKTSERSRCVENNNLARKYRKYYLKKTGNSQYSLINTTSGNELTPYVNGRKVKFWLLVQGRLNDDLDAAYFPIFYKKKVRQKRG